jgi:hypothetical protein
MKILDLKSLLNNQLFFIKNAISAIFSVLVVISLLTPSPTFPQTFSQFTSAAVASEGEGGFFVKAGKDIFRACAVSRFLLNPMSDIGIQAGIDRMCDTYSYGAAVDIKFYLIGGKSSFPLDLALDLSLGHMRAEEIIRNIFGGSLLVSRVFTNNLRFPIEPYVSVNIFSTQYSEKPYCSPGSRRCWPCKSDQNNSETESVLRMGTRFKISEDIHLVAEGEINGHNYLGLGINIIY